jgi:hypothetical protein
MTAIQPVGALVPIPPVIQVSSTITAFTATMSLTITDVQGRHQWVEFQSQAGSGTASSWSTATGTYAITNLIYNYTVTVTTSDILTMRWRVYGFDLNNTPNQLLAAGQQQQFNTGVGVLPAATEGQFLVYTGGAWDNVDVLTDEDEVLVDANDVLYDVP